jgi:hypothetical protein
MKTLVRFALIVAACYLLSQNIYAQKKQIEVKEISNRYHKIAFIISHSHIPVRNDVTGEKKTFIAASLGLNYEFWFNGKWAIGFHNDITMQSIHVNDEASGKTIERELPVLSSLVAAYKPWKHWSFFTGPGYEFEKNEGSPVLKTGAEYSIELPTKWEVGLGIDYDIKVPGYNSWLVGFGISRRFGAGGKE